MKVLAPLVIVGLLFSLGLLGAVPGLGWVFGVVLPYLALVVFLGGLAYRVLRWAKVPIPFRIPTTCGQQKSLGWIKPQRLENPPDKPWVVGRMALEILCFRSLLKNTKSELIEGDRVVYGTALGLWLGALVMHWAFLVILIRHLRFLTSPVPAFVTFVESVDGFLEVAYPVLYVTTVLFLVAAAYLLIRRLASAQMRYISLASDYFPLFLLLGIGLSGFFLRHVFKTNLYSVKELAIGLTHLSPVVPAGISPLFYGHLFLVCVLLAYFPFSKLVHMPGVFMSPTRNMANNNRRVRHINPWDYPVKVHTYEEYEDEFREKMIAAGLPVDKE